MTNPRREQRIFIAVLSLLLVAATIGFWGEPVFNKGRIPTIRDPGAEEWLAEPLPPTTLDAAAEALLSGSPLGGTVAGDANPFVTAAEDLRGQRRDVGATERTESCGAAHPSSGDWPELRAVISLNGEERVLLSSLQSLGPAGADPSPLRVGDRIGGWEVLEIAGQHVLVKGEEGYKWLHLSVP